ncbi:MAG TPA: urate hydroxylase PuuD [Chloroflexaceae bacterium]|nr:urate hydroxylase PuuD [Chloroflexaceae bacterium]
MDTTLRELLDLLVRWVHVIAGIMWIGNSLLFNWLDRVLTQEDTRHEQSFGKTWLLHSGAFYEVEKTLLPPGKVPSPLHWFMFQNLTTWVSGIFLLVLVYYMGGAAYMIDADVSSISPGAAVALGVATLVGGWFVYDLLWRSPLGRNPALASALSLALLLGATYGLTQVLSGRAAYIHVGALLGTLMTGNVWLYIVPSQRGLVAATRAGRPQDPTLSQRAKLRSIHNNYMTFPVIFIMISNHYPSAFASGLNWLILAVLMVASALVRHGMNVRFTTRRWLPATFGAGLVGLVAAWALMARPWEARPAAAGPVSFAEVQAVMDRRCATCHAVAPTDPLFAAPPGGVVLTTPEQLRAYADRIRVQVVETRAMPLGNRTGMTDEERALVARWLDAGAPLE